MRMLRRMIAVGILCCLVLTLVACVHYLPRDEEGTTTPDPGQTENSTPPTEGSTPEENDPPSPDEIPNEAEGGYTKRH